MLCKAIPGQLWNICYNLERETAWWVSRTMFYMSLFDVSLCQILPKISHQELNHVLMTSARECSKKPHGN